MTQYFPTTIKYVFDPVKGLIQEIAETSTVTFASGTIVEVSGVFAYVPEDPSKWSTVPTNVIQALDYLAAGSGSGGGGGGSPGGSNGDIQYRVDGTTFGGVSKIRFVGGDVFVTGSFLGNVEGTSSYAINAGNAVTASYALNAEFSWQQAIFVSKNGSDATADGTLNNPYLTISGALASINDASPTKRYIINVNPGTYTEAGILQLKANVFINGFDRNTVRISPTSFALSPDFSGGAGVDNRSGFSNVTLVGNCDFNWTTVTSSAGKLYFQNCVFNNNVTLTGYNNTIAQTATTNCLFFGSWTLSGINAATHQGNIHYGAVSLTQHPSLPTLLTANGGGAGSTTVTTTVNNFGRRCACFFYSFWAGSLTIDGPSSYVDATQSSLDTAGPITSNGGTFVSIGTVVNSTLSNLTNPTSINANLVPDTTSLRYNGDLGKQWLFNFNYLNLSTGTELYIGTVDSSYDILGSVAGYDVYIQPDQYGVRNNVNGGKLDLRTAPTAGTGSSGNVDVATGNSVNGNSGNITLVTGTPSGTGTRGQITFTARQIDASTTPLLHKWQSGATGGRPAGLVAGDVGRTFFDTTIGRPIWWDGTNWINAAGTIV